MTDDVEQLLEQLRTKTQAVIEEALAAAPVPVEESLRRWLLANTPEDTKVETKLVDNVVYVRITPPQMITVTFTVPNEEN